MKHARLSAMCIAAVTAVAGCSGDSPTAAVTDGDLSSVSASESGRYVILSETGNLPPGIAAAVAAAGGTLARAHDEIGVAVATSSAPSFRARLAKLPGVASVTPDHMMQWTPLDPKVRDLAEANASEVGGQVASIADNEPLYFLQWAPAVVQAPEAWNAGYTGEGVRVAVLDGGLYNAHPDLLPNVDVAASRSFVPGFDYNQDTGTFWHGTHVAGIIGAADNSIGVIGIAPDATLIGVKVLHNGSGLFSWLTEAIVYAATPVAEGGAGADVVNMSLGALIEGAKDQQIKADVRELMKAVGRATQFARQQGVVVIAAAGNDATSLDANDVVSTPAQGLSVISVAATGPLGWALGATDFERPASYTNYGKKVVTVAAPGGDFALPGEDLCLVGPQLAPCWVFDMYLSTSRAGWSWAAGTSMAAPVTAGIAALIIEAAGGQASPAYVEARLKQGAADFGKPGFDAWYGHGFVNAYRSVAH